MTRSVYYIPRWEGGKHGNAILFLPEYHANPGNIVFYVHMGQHGEACTSYYAKETKPIRTLQQREEIVALLREYTSRLAPGERLTERVKDTKRFREARYAYLKQSSTL